MSVADFLSPPTSLSDEHMSTAQANYCSPWLTGTIPVQVVRQQKLKVSRENTLSQSCLHLMTAAMHSWKKTFSHVPIVWAFHCGKKACQKIPIEGCILHLSVCSVYHEENGFPRKKQISESKPWLCPKGKKKKHLTCSKHAFFSSIPVFPIELPISILSWGALGLVSSSVSD